MANTTLAIAKAKFKFVDRTFGALASKCFEVSVGLIDLLPCILKLSLQT